MPLLYSKQRLLLPVNPSFVFLTLAVAVLFNCLPFSGVPFAPDFIVLILLFWAIHEPLQVSMGTGFILGLFMDVISSTALGQYVLAYVVLAYLANRFSRRVLSFELPGQIFHVLPMLLLAQGVVAAVGFAVTNRFVDPLFFSSTITAGLLWPLCNLLLIAPQRRAVEKDENRPI